REKFASAKIAWSVPAIENTAEDLKSRRSTFYPRITAR
ncbi:MAG: hypothetical protein ACI90V_010873, partial [Bacillariaceae sp.]